MNRKKVVSFMQALSLAAVPIALAGCGSGGGLIATQSPEEALESAEITWNGYTMGIDCVTADQERMAGSELSGQGIRITFRCISDEAGHGGFDGNTIFEDLEASPIILKDSSGTEYEFTGGVTDITLTITGNSLEISDSMPRFGMVFDVPAGTELGDYTLVVGDSTLTLAEFVTPEYAEYIAD